MPKRNIVILVLAILVVVAVAVAVSFLGVQQAPTEAIIEGPGTEDPLAPEPAQAPPAQ